MSVLETVTVDNVTYDMHDPKVGSGTLSTSAQTLIPAVNELKSDLSDLYDDVHGPVEVYSWANGTEAQIKAMVDAHYANQINLYDYWSVGDTREITLNGETQELVLMHKGGKELVTAINGHTECVFVVGLKNCMAETMVYHNAYTTVLWRGLLVQTYCNNTFRGYFSSIMQSLFKQFKNVTCQYDSVEQTNDYFTIPAHREVFLTLNNTTSNENNYLSTFDWYRSMGNTYKHIPGSAATATYWLRSYCQDGSHGNEYMQYYSNVVNESYDTGYQRKSNSASDTKRPVSPYGVI